MKIFTILAALGALVAGCMWGWCSKSESYLARRYAECQTGDAAHTLFAEEMMRLAGVHSRVGRALRDGRINLLGEGGARDMLAALYVVQRSNEELRGARMRELYGRRW